MFRFVKQIFTSTMIFFGSLSNASLLECILMKNQECKVRPKIINTNSNNPIFYPFNIKTNKCSGKCNNINDPYARTFVPDTVKNLNVKVFDLLSLTNETRHLKWHDKCKCICRLDGFICNNKQRWNDDKCFYEFKKLIDKGVCDKGFICNSSNFECECDISCNIGKYLDYLNCKCRKKLVDKLAEECTENIEEAKLVKKTLDKNETTLGETKYEKLYWISFIFFIISIGISIYFIYFVCRKYVNSNKYGLPY